LIRPLLRLAALACLAYMAVALYVARGVTSAALWCVVTVLVGLVAASLAGLLAARRRRVEQLGERALHDPALRPRALAQLKPRVATLARGPRTRQKREAHARLSVLLAELLDADGAHADAVHTIDAVELSPLPALDAALVLHTRAVIHLRAGRPQSALSALAQRAHSGDEELEVRLDLLTAYARAELGAPHEALDEAERVLRLYELDESVQAEARVVRAVALDLLGRREEALVVITSLGRSSLEPLAELGQPRARALARAALSGFDA
jgi:tetratricopeptide (TPR) repeat protein